MTTEYNLPPSGRFTKKPATIEAWLIDFDNKPLPEWVDAGFVRGNLEWSPDGEGLYINTLEGCMLGSNGDYLIRGVHGELYACKPAIFAATYEPESAAIEADRAVKIDDLERGAVAYLDIGTGGHLDLGSDLSDEELLQLPAGRHCLAIVGTYGANGYVPLQQDTKDAETASARRALAALRDKLLTLETDAHSIFNNPPGETPQEVRDVIEWFKASLMVDCDAAIAAQKGQP